MTPEQLRDAIADNSVDSTHNSYGSCRHNVSFVQPCGKCEMERYSISQRAPGWFEKQAREFPDRLSRDILKFQDEEARDDATLQEIQRIAARYSRHTVDIGDSAPQYVEGEMLAVEKGWRRANVAWVVLGVLVVGFVVGWRVSGGR